MARRGEGAARYIDQESCSGPDPDSRHAGQDRVKRVSKYEALNFLRHFLALDAQGRLVVPGAGRTMLAAWVLKTTTARSESARRISAALVFGTR